VYLAGEASGWPVPFSIPDYRAPGPWLSALTQGNGIAVLARAYWLTGADIFLDTARRAVRTFERDILDGGVSAPLGEEGVFFETVAVYPAAHLLSGFILSLFGLYDYVALTGDDRVAALIRRGLATLHGLIGEYDTGYWTRGDLLHRRLATPFEHALHVTLLGALARCAGCDHCAALAACWAAYRQRFSFRLRAFVTARSSGYRRAIWSRLQPMLVGASGEDRRAMPARVCVPITAFPVAGGMRSVLEGVMQAMAGEWQMEYLTQYVGPHGKELTVLPFGSRIVTPWQFPTVWLYVFTGWCKLIALFRHGHRYDLVLPQDGVFTGAFAALAARMAGVRVVCVDHGNVTLLHSHAYRAERMQALRARPRFYRIFTRLQLAWYWPSLCFLARIATRYSDHFLAAGDDVAEAYQRHLGVHPSRITCFPFMVDVSRYTPPDAARKTCLRAQNRIAADAIVVTMINRLAPEKGLDIALQGTNQALAVLPDDLRARVRVLIAGDGPLRTQVEADIHRYGLDAVCMLWGEATSEEVATLLGISDIFLYTGRRAINSMAVLEAMAAGCVVIAATAPPLIARYLADGRGMAIPVGDVDTVGAALVEAITSLESCRQMGYRAREYVAIHHSSTALKRALLRAAGWPGAIADGPVAFVRTVCADRAEEGGS